MAGESRRLFVQNAARMTRLFVERMILSRWDRARENVHMWTKPGESPLKLVPIKACPDFHHVVENINLTA